MTLAFAFLLRDIRITLSYKIAFVMQMVSVFIAVPIFFFMGELVDEAAPKALEPYGGSYFGFLLIGIALLDYLAVSLRSFGQSLRDSQLTGTLEIILLSPTPLTQMLLYSSIWSFLFTTLRFVLYLVVGSLFALDLGEANLLGAILILFMGILSFIPFGVLTASLIMWLKRGEMLNSLVSAASMFFGGVLYPVASMPPLLQMVSKLLPFTYALEGMRLAIQQGHSLTQLAPQFLALALFAAVLLPLSLTIFAAAVRHTKSTGTLGDY